MNGGMTAAGLPSHNGSCGLAWCGQFLLTNHSEISGSSFPIIPDSKLAIQANTQMPEQVLYVLITVGVSL